MPRLEFRGSEIVDVYECRDCGGEYTEGGPGRCPDCLEGSE